MSGTKDPVILSTPAEVLAALHKVEAFVDAELAVRVNSFGEPAGREEDEAADIADAEQTLALIRGAIAKIGGGCE
jgi:hypothetical protein